MQLDAELTTPDYKSIFRSSAYFYQSYVPFLQRGIVRYVEIRYPDVRRKFQRSRLTRRFDGGNTGSQLRTSRNTDFRECILPDIR